MKEKKYTFEVKIGNNKLKTFKDLRQMTFYINRMPFDLETYVYYSSGSSRGLLVSTTLSAYKVHTEGVPKALRIQLAEYLKPEGFKGEGGLN